MTPMAKLPTLTPDATNHVIRMAWEDRTTFEEIEKKFGLSESQTILVMRGNLKPSSFRRWRARVNGRATKHRKILKMRLQS